MYSRLLLQIELDVPPRVHNEPACMSASLHICRKAVNCDALQYSMSRPFAQELQSKCLHSSFLNPSCHCLELGDLAVVPLPLEISSSCDLGIAIFLLPAWICGSSWSTILWPHLYAFVRERAPSGRELQPESEKCMLPVLLTRHQPISKGTQQPAGAPQMLPVPMTRIYSVGGYSVVLPRACRQHFSHS